VIRRLAWLALIPPLAAAGGSGTGRGGAGELSFTVGDTYLAPCVAPADALSRARRLGAIGSAGGSWSHDGERVALIVGRAIGIENADGSDLRIVTRPRPASEDDGAPAWSPDGAAIAFSRYTGSSRNGVWIVDLATRTERQLTNRFAQSLAWSPTGDVIAADYGGDPQAEIVLIDPQGTVQRRFEIPGFKHFNTGVGWSPDGLRLAVAGGAVLDRTGTIVGRYADPSTDQAVSGAPSWSPDGSLIAFVRFATQYNARTNFRYTLQSDLYVTRVDGGPATRLTQTPDVSESGPEFRPGAHATPAGSAQACVLRGTAGRDVIRGSRRDDLIFAGAGNDVVQARAGADFVVGDAGNDVLVGGPGRDFLLGGSGNDQLYARDGTGDLVYGGPGSDRATRDPKLDTLANVERVIPR
jgi:dipeptidyl aminopeptidase/acylaminoacyl peptidase